MTSFRCSIVNNHTFQWIFAIVLWWRKSNWCLNILFHVECDRKLDMPVEFHFMRIHIESFDMDYQSRWGGTYNKLLNRWGYLFAGVTSKVILNAFLSKEAKIFNKNTSPSNHWAYSYYSSKQISPESFQTCYSAHCNFDKPEVTTFVLKKECQ